MDHIPQIYIPNRPLIPGGPGITRAPKPGQGTPQKGDQNKVSFEEVLKTSVDTQEKLKLSTHAQERARSRNISLDERQMARLSDGVEKAEGKGARDALVLVDNIAAIVSVDNKTVVTVTDTKTLRDNVFTNIDSAVIA